MVCWRRVRSGRGIAIEVLQEFQSRIGMDGLRLRWMICNRAYQMPGGISGPKDGFLFYDRIVKRTSIASFASYTS